MRKKEREGERRREKEREGERRREKKEVGIPQRNCEIPTSENCYMRVRRAISLIIIP